VTISIKYAQHFGTQHNSTQCNNRDEKININEAQHNATQRNNRKVTLSRRTFDVKCHYSEFCNADCRIFKSYVECRSHKHTHGYMWVCLWVGGYLCKHSYIHRFVTHNMHMFIHIKHTHTNIYTPVYTIK
jgi:hypothetical protein